MNEPYVSSYDEQFMEAFDRGVQQLPEDRIKVVKDIVDKIHEEVITQLHYYIEDDLKKNVDAQIRDHASKVASSMLANALAGDDQEIRKLFGFSDWYMKYAGVNRDLPTQWALIDALIARRPDIFVDERIKQREREIAALTERVGRLEAANLRLREYYGEAQP